MVENLQALCIDTAYACAVGVGIALVSYGVVRGSKLLTRNARKLAAVSLIGAILVGGMVVVGTDGAGTKQMENGEWRMGNVGRAAAILRSPFSILHLDDWRVVSVSSNALPAATFTMPANAVVWESAQRYGRGWGSWKIPVGGWRFPFGEEGWTNAFVWAEGYFRSRFNSRANEITLLSERLALCPAAHWSRYNLAASRAWCMANV